MNDEFKNDHDALITIISEVRQIRADIKDLKDNNTARISALEETVEGLMNTKSAMKVYLAIYGLIGGFLGTILIYHLMGK